MCSLKVTLCVQLKGHFKLAENHILFNLCFISIITEMSLISIMTTMTSISIITNITIMQT